MARRRRSSFMSLAPVDEARSPGGSVGAWHASRTATMPARCRGSSTSDACILLSRRSQFRLRQRVPPRQRLARLVGLGQIAQQVIGGQHLHFDAQFSARCSCLPCGASSCSLPTPSEPMRRRGSAGDHWFRALLVSSGRGTRRARRAPPRSGTATSRSKSVGSSTPIVTLEIVSS